MCSFQVQAHPDVPDDFEINNEQTITQAHKKRLL